MNRDDSVEAKKDEQAPSTEVPTDSVEAKTEKAPTKEVPTHTNIDRVTRMRITKRAKRFERYGLIQDGQQLVDLIADIAGGLEGKATSEVHVRHHKKDES